MRGYSCDISAGRDICIDNLLLGIVILNETKSPHPALNVLRVCLLGLEFFVSYIGT